MSATREQLERLDAISCGEDPRHLEELAAILPTLSYEGCGEPVFTALLGIFERSPLSDGFESYWSIVHFLEACDGYEPYLLESIAREPTELTLTMVNRLINAGLRECGGVAFLEVLGSVAARADVDPRLKELARKSVQYQRRGGSDA